MNHKYKLEDYVTPELVAILEWMFPSTPVTPDKNINQLMYESGQQSVILKIITAFEKSREGSSISGTIMSE